MSMTGMDFAMGGGRVKYREIATAAANQTYGAQLTQLKTTWNTLTDEEKMRCVIRYGNYMMIPEGNIITAGIFIRISTDTNKMVVSFMSMSACVYSYTTIQSSSVTTSDNSSVTNANAMSLMLLDVVSE